MNSLWAELTCVQCNRRNLVRSLRSLRCYGCGSVTHFGDGRHSDDADEGKPHPDDLLAKIGRLKKALSYAIDKSYLDYDEIVRISNEVEGK